MQVLMFPRKKIDIGHLKNCIPSHIVVDIVYFMSIYVILNVNLLIWREKKQLLLIKHIKK